MKDKVPNFDLRKSQGFEAAYNYYARRIYRHVLIRTNSQEDAEELTSKTFLRVLEYVKSGNKVRNPGAFIYKSANRLVIDWYRAKAVKQSRSTPLDEDEFDPPDPNSLQENVATKNEAERVMEYMDLLNDKNRMLLTLRFVDDLSLQEMSEVLGKSRGAISVALNRALTDLRNIIKKNPCND